MAPKMPLRCTFSIPMSLRVWTVHMREVTYVSHVLDGVRRWRFDLQPVHGCLACERFDLMGTGEPRMAAVAATLVLQVP